MQVLHFILCKSYVGFMSLFYVGKRQSYAGFMCGFMQVLCGSYVSVLCGFYAGHIKKDFFFRSSYAGLMGVLNYTLYIIFIFFAGARIRPHDRWEGRQVREHDHYCARTTQTLTSWSVVKR